MVEIPEPILIALARQRGLALDAERAAVLRPLLESLLTRTSRFGGARLSGTEPPPDRFGEEAP